MRESANRAGRAAVRAPPRRRRAGGHGADGRGLAQRGREERCEERVVRACGQLPRRRSPEPAPSEKRPIRAKARRRRTPRRRASGSTRARVRPRDGARAGVGALAPERARARAQRARRATSGIVGAANHGKFGSTIWAQAHANVAAAPRRRRERRERSARRSQRRTRARSSRRRLSRRPRLLSPRRERHRSSSAVARALRRRRRRRGRARAQGHRALHLDVRLSTPTGAAFAAAARGGARDSVAARPATRLRHRRIRGSRRARTSRRRRRRSASRAGVSKDGDALAVPLCEPPVEAALASQRASRARPGHTLSGAMTLAEPHD